MGEILKIGNEFIRKEELDKLSNDVLALLKKEKRTYLFNKSILKTCLDKLDVEQNSKIFQ